MWDDENDKRIREAAENFQPPFDEKAWEKMEKLLDENLPRERDRKRILFFIPFVLTLGALVFFFFYNNNKPQNLKQNITMENVTSDQNGSPNKPLAEPDEVSKTGSKNNSEIIATNKKSISEKQKYHSVQNSKSNALFTNEKIGKRNFDEVKPVTEIENNQPAKDEISKESKPTNQQNVYPAQEKKDIEQNVEENKTKDSSETAVVTERNDASKNLKSSQQKQKNKNPKSFADHFSFGLSAGPGISFIGNENGKVTLDVGVIAGYSFLKNFGLHTGIFFSKKIYTVAPSDYYFPPGSTYNYLEKVNANCNVVAIPLNLDYFFNQKKDHLWFVSAGLSSYLMKKESYDYVYEDPGGSTYVKNRTYNNQNKHYFSVIDLSAGYQFKISNHFSLAAQPYVDLPITGIGAGKVKLNTAGILFTLKANKLKSSK
ncbi:MAG TPA: hypothetical protein VFT78_14420 [Hanamia sp.]|nr:hypothetical protein [Hanamia sp.]